MKIEFSIPVQVVPKQSTRFGNGRAYQAKTGPRARMSKNAEALAHWMAPHVPTEPLSGPLSLSLVLRHPWRSNEPQKRRKRSRPKDTLPDVDNLTKQVCDVLQRMGFFANDGQIAHLEVWKFWTDEAGVDVILETIDE